MKLPRPYCLDRTYSIVGALALAAAGCTHGLPPEEAAPIAAAQPGRPVPRAAGAPQGTPWVSDAPQPFVREMSGRPIQLPKGQRCKVYRDLPSVVYGGNTLVKDACLRIPNGAVIQVRDGATLAIIATSGLFVGTNVVFEAQGARGRRGARAAFASVPFEPTTDLEIQALCVDHGNQCACPTNEASLAPIRGRSGLVGSRGGSVELVAEELASPGGLSGLSFDLSGGLGGPPGDSGTQECTRGKWRCMSDACVGGAAPGAPGANGLLSLAFAGTPSSASLERMQAVLALAGADGTVATGRNVVVEDRQAVLEARAIREGWRRQAGQEAY